MKKSLLILTAAAVMATSAAANTYDYFPEMMISKISPNGKWAYSEVYFGSFDIINLETQETFGPYIFNDVCYQGGLGNSISNNGIVLANEDFFNVDARYFEDGEWKWLPLLEETPIYGNTANGITPEGDRICGQISAAKIDYDLGGYYLPCFWDRKADGTYGEPVMLPFPDKDFTGRMPQYCTAVCISDDGKTIVGQMVDYSGFLQYPIVYREAADGSWSYELLNAKDLFLSDFDFPEYPYDSEQPAEVDATKYMTDEKAAAYNDFFDQNGYYPDAADYISEDQIAAYNAAIEEYNKAGEEWNERYFAFNAKFQEYRETIPMIEFNRCSLSPDGRYCLAAGFKDIHNEWGVLVTKIYSTFIFDTTTGEYKEINDSKNIQPSAVFNDGSVLGYTNFIDYTKLSYVLMPGAVEYIPLQDYLAPISAEATKWMTENLTYEIPIFKRDEYGSIILNDFGAPFIEGYEDMIITGQTCASSDFKVFASWIYDSWNTSSTTHDYFSTVVNLNEGSGIGNVETDNSATPAIFYNLQGIKVPAGNITPGIYVKIQGDKAEKIYVK